MLNYKQLKDKEEFIQAMSDYYDEATKNNYKPICVYDYNTESRSGLRTALDYTIKIIFKKRRRDEKL